MWTARLTQASAGKTLNVVLAHDDVTYFISLDDWWVMSATQYLADKALKESNLDFKMSELWPSTQPTTCVDHGPGFEWR